MKPITVTSAELESLVAALVEANHGCTTLETARLVTVHLKRRGWRLETDTSASDRPSA